MSSRYPDFPTRLSDRGDSFFPSPLRPSKFLGAVVMRTCGLGSFPGGTVSDDLVSGPKIIDPQTPALSNRSHF